MDPMQDKNDYGPENREGVTLTDGLVVDMICDKPAYLALKRPRDCCVSGRLGSESRPRLCHDESTVDGESGEGGIVEKAERLAANGAQIGVELGPAPANVIHNASHPIDFDRDIFISSSGKQHGAGGVTLNATESGLPAAGPQKVARLSEMDGFSNAFNGHSENSTVKAILEDGHVKENEGIASSSVDTLVEMSGHPKDAQYSKVLFSSPSVSKLGGKMEGASAGEADISLEFKTEARDIPPGSMSVHLPGKQRDGDPTEMQQTLFGLEEKEEDLSEAGMTPAIVSLVHQRAEGKEEHYTVNISRQRSNGQYLYHELRQGQGVQENHGLGQGGQVKDVGSLTFNKEGSEQPTPVMMKMTVSTISSAVSAATTPISTITAPVLTAAAPASTTSALLSTATTPVSTMTIALSTMTTPAPTATASVSTTTPASILPSPVSTTTAMAEQSTTIGLDEAGHGMVLECERGGIPTTATASRQWDHRVGRGRGRGKVRGRGRGRGR
ncbi:unnamed protein product, partial [Choristocarpus tenellus]